MKNSLFSCNITKSPTDGPQMFVRNAKWGIGQSKNTPCKWSKVYEGRSREPVHMQGPKTVKFAACVRVGGNQIDSGSEEFSLIYFVSNYILL